MLGVNKNKQSEEAKKNMEAQEASVVAEKSANEKAKENNEESNNAASKEGGGNNLGTETDVEKAKKDANLVKDADKLLSIMNRFKVDTIYRNSKKELFTNENLAHVSEGNNKGKVKSYHRSVLEAIVNTKK